MKGKTQGSPILAPPTVRHDASVVVVGVVVVGVAVVVDGVVTTTISIVVVVVDGVVVVVVVVVAGALQVLSVASEVAFPHSSPLQQVPTRPPQDADSARQTVY